MKPTRFYITTLLCVLATATAVYARQDNTSIEELLKRESSDITQRRMHKQPLSEYQISLIKQLDEEKKYKLANARKAYREGRYADSASLYETVPALSSPDEKWEVAEAYQAAGATEKSLIWYRKALYQTITCKQLSSLGSLQPSPRAVLPLSAQSVKDAAERFPDEEIEVWSDQSPLKLGHFAIVLARKKKFAEAIAVYQRALEHVSEPGWKTALSLGNITDQNFDSRRFEAAAHTLAATGYADNGFQWHNLTGMPLEIGRTSELDEAIRLKPDYAPALYIKAAILLNEGEKNGQNRITAIDCLNQAQQCARSNEIRSMVSRLRADHNIPQ